MIDARPEMDKNTDEMFAPHSPLLSAGCWMRQGLLLSAAQGHDIVDLGLVGCDDYVLLAKGSS